MNWHEDYGDEPAIEERMPYGMTPEEMRDVMMEASCETCYVCGVKAQVEEFVETGMYEYYTMDIDPETFFCPACIEEYRMQFIPEDPSLFDCLTPLASY